MVIDWLRLASYAPPGTVKRVMTRRVMSHLIRDERVLVSTRHHPVVAIWPMPASLVILVLVAAATAQLSPGNPLIDVLWWGWFATVGYAGWRLLDWSNEIFVVTDRRVMLFTGFLTRRIAMMPLVKVTDLTYQRTLGGRLLRYGDLVIESAGQDQALHTVRFLPNPGELYHDIAGTLFGRGLGRAAEGKPRRADSDGAATTTRTSEPQDGPQGDATRATAPAARGMQPPSRHPSGASGSSSGDGYVRSPSPAGEQEWRPSGGQNASSGRRGEPPGASEAPGASTTDGPATPPLWAAGAAGAPHLPPERDLDDTVTLPPTEE